jgi:sec-independent protein translocase protein TatA
MFAWTLGGTEIIIILLVGVLLFGRRLPEVGRYLGKGIVEFKKGIKGVEDDIDVQSTSSGYSSAAEPPRPPQRLPAREPKFQDQPTDSEGAPRV